MALDIEVRNALHGFRRDSGEHSRGLRLATVIAGTVKQRILVNIYPLLSQHIDECRIQLHTAGELHSGGGFFLGHRDVDRIQQHGQCIALPRGHTDHQRELGHSGHTALGGLVIHDPRQVPFRRLQHPGITEQRIQANMSRSEQLRNAGRMGMRHIKFGHQLVRVLQRRGGQHAAILVTPATDAVQTVFSILILRLGHLLAHFPTASRYS